MSPDILKTVASLTSVLEEEAQLLSQLAAHMEQNRAGFVSLGAARLLESMEKPAEAVSGFDTLEQERQRLASELAAGLGIDGEFRVSRALPLLPREPGRNLQTAADNLQQQARRVRAETIVGNRLLRLSERANAGILAALVGASPTSTNVRYDANARIEPDAGNSTGPGNLISGTA